MCASCPAGSLAWASDRAGPGWLGPAQKKTKKLKIKKNRKNKNVYA